MRLAIISRRTVLLSSLVLSSTSPAIAQGFDAHRLWTVQGSEAGAGFGSAVATGDVNDDGFRDVFVGAPHGTTSAGAPDGKVFGYYGGAGGPSLSPSWTAEGERGGGPSSQFGFSLGCADMNGDGFDDLIVGSPRFDTLEDYQDFVRGAGRLYVYYGSAQGLPAVPSFVADGQGYDQALGIGIGYTLQTGDFNGDGFTDVVASKYEVYVGGAAVYYGSATGLSQDNSWIVRGGPRWLGASASVGDFDGDGYDDLILTTETQRPVEDGWQVLVYRGSPNGFPPVPPPPGHPAASFTFPSWTTAASVGDVDGDGYDDILALELDNDGCICNAPTYVLYRGSPAGPVRSRELATTLADAFPVVYPIGDLNGDGFADLIAVEKETFLVHFGSAAGLDPLSNGMGPTPIGPFAPARDVDGDGIGDMVVGDGGHERADLYRGGADWSFGLTADLAVQQLAFADASGSELTVTNAGPDTVRLRLFDPVPPTWVGASFSCYHLPPGGPYSGATARCLHLPAPTGDLDSVITIAPGGGIVYDFGGGVLSLPVVSMASLILPDWVTDPDLSNNRSTLVMGPPVQMLFLDNFESGDLSAWSSHSGTGLAVTNEASLQGNYGLEVTAPVRGAAVARDDSPASESDYHAHFLFDPMGFGQRRARGCPRGSARARATNEAILFSGHAETSHAALFELRLENRAGVLSLRARGALNDGTVRESASIPITGARQLLEVAWRRSSGPTAKDGLLQLRFDGADAASLTGLDNDARGGVDFVELGLANAGRPLSGPIRRRVVVDGFESWRPN